MEGKEFDPSSLGLPSPFWLTDYAKLKGCGCKVPQADLLELLDGLQANPSAPVGMDCSIVPLSVVPGLFMVSTMDFFTPSVEDPYLQGRIACANVLSDLYAMGVTRCDNMLMALAASRDMKPEEWRIVSKEMIRGFSDLASEAGTFVTGGQTIFNPWPIVGGAAMSSCFEAEIIRPENACVGDVLVLTKPLGVRLAVNAHQWLHQSGGERWITTQTRCDATLEDVNRAYEMACESMSRLNRNGAILMHKYGAHSATDITGFGILRHANNLARTQKRKNLVFKLTQLPFLKKMLAIDHANDQVFKLASGLCAETSGGLLVVLPSHQNAVKFIEELEQLDGHPAWIVGHIDSGREEQAVSRAELDGYRVIEV